MSQSRVFCEVISSQGRWISLHIDSWVFSSAEFYESVWFLGLSCYHSMSLLLCIVFKLPHWSNWWYTYASCFIFIYFDKYDVIFICSSSCNALPLFLLLSWCSSFTTSLAAFILITMLWSTIDELNGQKIYAYMLLKIWAAIFMRLIVL